MAGLCQLRLVYPGLYAHKPTAVQAAPVPDLARKKASSAAVCRSRGARWMRVSTTASAWLPCAASCTLRQVPSMLNAALFQHKHWSNSAVVQELCHKLAWMLDACSNDRKHDSKRMATLQLLYLAISAPK